MPIEIWAVLVGLLGSLLVESLKDFFGLGDSALEKSRRRERYSTLVSVSETLLLGYLLFLALFTVTRVNLDSSYFQSSIEKNFYNGLFFFAVPVYVFAAINRKRFNLDFAFWIVVGFIAGLFGSLGSNLGQSIRFENEFFRGNLAELSAYWLWSTVLFLSLVRLGAFPKSRVLHFLLILFSALLVKFLVTGIVRANVTSKLLADPFLVPLLYAMLFLGCAIGASNASRQLSAILKDAAAVFVVVFFVWIVFRVVVDVWPDARIFLDAFKKFSQWYVVFALLMPHLQPTAKRI